jgi:hypothetical protein
MILKHSLVEGEIIEIKPFIFAAIIKDKYDRSMVFCRYQEYYESPFPEIRGNSFSLEEYMRIYSKRNKKDTFTYPVDWSGYNVPSNVLMEARKKFEGSLNDYDLVMDDMISYCNRESKFRNYGETHPWYLIGVDKLKSSIINHEIAHGLYYTNLNYKVEMDYHTSSILLKDSISLRKHLIKVGYVNDGKILDDEIQAYMSTGKLHSWSDTIYKKYSKEFVNTFKKYNK